MNSRRNISLCCAMAVLAALPTGCSHDGSVRREAAVDVRATIDQDPVGSAETEFVQIRDEYLKKYKPLVIESNEAWWIASTTGSKEAFARKAELENRLVDLHADTGTYERLAKLRRDDKIANPLLRRELDVMYRTFLERQGSTGVQKQMVALQNEIEQTFNKHRSEVHGKELTENDVREIVKSTKDSAEAQAAWLGYISVGRKVEDKLKQVVNFRNQIARELGYRDFFAMSLAMQEIDERDLLATFDSLDRLTAKPFAELKDEIDTLMAARFSIDKSELRPWHYGDLFFQDAPKLNEVDLDSIYANVDLLAMARDYYGSIEMDCSDILERGDLYEKDGKSSHAFATNIDRDKDVRILCNLKNDLYWADTLIHELGHAVYDKYIDTKVPFLLHSPSHSLTTEGYAMMMGSLVTNKDFLTRVVKVDPKEVDTICAAAHRSERAQKLMFSRWTQVMMRFEREMYANPNQDLSKLWWDLKARYQLLPRPLDESLPGYAAKIHVVNVPVYYHNYQLGDLFASQVREDIAHTLKIDNPDDTCFYGMPEAGRYMKERIFEPGNLYSWNALTLRATGSTLKPDAFARQYVK